MKPVRLEAGVNGVGVAWNWTALYTGKTATKWTRVTLAYNRKRMVRLETACPVLSNQIPASSRYHQYRSTHQSGSLLHGAITTLSC